MTTTRKDEGQPDGMSPVARGGAGKVATEAIDCEQPLDQPWLERLAPEEPARAVDAERMSWELWRAACRVWG